MLRALFILDVIFYVIENSLLHITKNISTIEQEFMIHTLLFEITHMIQRILKF